MMEPLHRFLRLTGRERRIVLEAVAALPATRLAVRVAGYNICKAALARSIAAENPDSNLAGTIEMAQNIARLEAATARNLFFRVTCLEQSLVLCWMLRRRGMSPILRIGARKEADRFEAHAWVELDGIVIGDASGEHRHFTPFENPGVSLETQTH
jgi:hypothetical protein